MAEDESKIVINQSICRVCLRSSSVTHSLGDLIVYEDKIEIKELLKRVTNIEIIVNELQGMPSRICEICTQKLIDAYEFISEVERSEKMLQESYVEINAKDFIEVESVLSEEYDKEVEEVQAAADHLENNSDSYIAHELEILDEELENYLKSDVQNEDGILHIKQECEYNVNAEPMEVNETVAFQCADKSKQQLLSTDKPASFEEVAADVKPPCSILRSTTTATVRYECKQCSRLFAKQTTLQRHMTVAHTILNPDQITMPVAKSAEQKIICPHCPRILTRRDNLLRHMQAMHPDEAEIWAREEGREDKPKNRYKRGLCPYCGQSFSQASLIIHIRRHTGEFPYQCNECEKAFPRRQDLIIHQRKHTGEKPYVCGACGKSFIRPNKLTRHMRIHTGARPYKCDKCEKSFSQSNDLKIHIRRHTGEKPYKCGICSEAFICGSALTAHRKAKRHEEPEENMPDPFAAIRVSNRSKNVVSVADAPIVK